MCAGKTKLSLITFKIHDCWQASNAISCHKHTIAQQFEVCLLVIVYGYENDAAVGEKLFSDTEALLHKGKPLGMTVRVFLVHKRVVVDKVLVSGIVRRVDVDYIDFAGVGVGESRQRDKIVALNN